MVNTTFVCTSVTGRGSKIATFLHEVVYDFVVHIYAMWTTFSNCGGGFFTWAGIEEISLSESACTLCYFGDAIGTSRMTITEVIVRYSSPISGKSEGLPRLGVLLMVSADRNDGGVWNASQMVKIIINTIVNLLWRSFRWGRRWRH